jgi:hypothetical protein
MKKNYRKQLADQKHNHGGSQQKAHVAEHMEEKEATFYAFMACTQVDHSKSSAWFVNSGASRHFTNQKDWFTEFTPSPSKDSVIFSGGEEYNIVGKGNVQISFRGKMLMFLNIHYVPGMELNLLSVSQIMRHSPHLDVNFRNHKCYIIDNNTKKIIALGVRTMVCSDWWILGRAESMQWQKKVHQTSAHYGIRVMGTSILTTSLSWHERNW